MDRNQRARDDFRRQEEIAKMQRQFAQAVAAGQAQVLDRFSKPIVEGSLVVWKCPQDWVWLISEVKPLLGPQDPQGCLQLTMTVTVPAVCRVNSPVVEMIVVGQQPKDAPPALTPIGESDRERELRQRVEELEAQREVDDPATDTGRSR